MQTGVSKLFFRIVGIWVLNAIAIWPESMYANDYLSIFAIIIFVTKYFFARYMPSNNTSNNVYLQKLFQKGEFRASMPFLTIIPQIRCFLEIIHRHLEIKQMNGFKRLPQSSSQINSPAVILKYLEFDYQNWGYLMGMKFALFHL